MLAVIIAAAGVALKTTDAATPTASPTAATAAAPQQTSTPSGIPAAPTEAALIGGAEVFWKDNSNNEAGFRITVRVSGSPYRVATYEAAANANSFLLPPDAPHVCEKNGGPALFGSVVAFSTVGESSPSHFGLFAVCGDAPAPTSTARVTGTPTPRRTGTPLAVPAAPSNVLLLGGAQVLWKDNSDNETGFRITISIGGESVGRMATYDVPANITSIILPPNAPHVCERTGDYGIDVTIVAFNDAGTSELAGTGVSAECGFTVQPAVTAVADPRLPDTGSGDAGGRGGRSMMSTISLGVAGALLTARGGLARRRSRRSR
jgi:hypothetical protein